MTVKLEKSLERFLIPPSMSVKQAMRRLEETEERVLFVTDESERRLLGSLSDGDVRRWILSEGLLSAPVGSAKNSEPYSVNIHFDLAVVKVTMLEQRISCVPVLDWMRVWIFASMSTVHMPGVNQAQNSSMTIFTCSASAGAVPSTNAAGGKSARYFFIASVCQASGRVAT